MKECYLVYSCDSWKSIDSMQLKYIIEDKNELFQALRYMVENKEIEVNDFNCDVEASRLYLYTYQNNMNKLQNGKLDITYLNDRIKYVSIQKSHVGFNDKLN